MSLSSILNAVRDDFGPTRRAACKSAISALLVLEYAGACPSSSRLELADFRCGARRLIYVDWSWVRTTAREDTEGRDSVMNTYETDSMTLSRPLVLFVSLSGLNTSVRPSSPHGEFPGSAENKCSAVRASWCVRFTENARCIEPHPEERPSRRRGRVSKDGRRIPSLRHTLRDGRAIASVPVGPAVLRAS